MIVENAHMHRRTSRKSARGGRALLTGLVRCGRCGHMMRVFMGPKQVTPTVISAVVIAIRAAAKSASALVESV